MASNLHRRLDRLERLIRERFSADSSPIYLRPDEPIPEEVDPQRVIWVKRDYIDPPQRVEEELPKMDAPVSSPPIERFQRKFEYQPPLGIV
jgi:hypothetical protein